MTRVHVNQVLSIRSVAETDQMKAERIGWQGMKRRSVGAKCYGVARLRGVVGS
jgi:hypothetical protein